jgi:UDP-N-acetylglucosamine--N-acetylmuramyl-(pentapeptide) pyrophosphoryl-undecaprenol N-acetylglucosamine transferase
MSSQSSAPLIAFAGGGTGGHLYPMLSVAAKMRSLVPDVRFAFFTTQRPIDRRVIREFFPDETTAGIVEQPVQPLPRSVGGVFGFVRAWRASTKVCAARFGEDRPDIVIGSGGFGSAPPIHVGRSLGVATALLNPDAVPGKANRFLASRADVIFVQWPVTRSHLRRHRRVEVVGCPIRDAFAEAERSDGVARFGLDSNRRTLVVTGASQGARSINDAFVGMAEHLAKLDAWQILHLAGREDVERMNRAYEQVGASATVIDYTDQMADVLGVADVIVSRAGASTLAEISAVGVPSVLIPYPYHKDRHQYANAAALFEQGACVVVDDPVRDRTSGESLLAAILELMSDENVRAKMAQRARELGRTDAASHVARYVLDRIGYDESARGHEQGRDWRTPAPTDDKNFSACSRSAAAVCHDGAGEVSAQGLRRDGAGGRTYTKGMACK